MNTNIKKMIHHLGLQIIEKDLQPFYFEVLGCKLLRKFNLSKEEAFSIFNILKDVEIIYTRCENIELELFIDNIIKSPSFCHVCLHSHNVMEIVNKAKIAGFHIYIREKKDNSKTYFISDSNYNLFEIKNN